MAKLVASKTKGKMYLNIDVAPTELENYAIISKYYNTGFEFLIAIPNSTNIGTSTVYLKVKIYLPRGGCGLHPISFNKAVTFSGAPPIDKVVSVPTPVLTTTADATSTTTTADATSTATTADATSTATTADATASTS